MKTEIIYVISPDYVHFLRVSLDSLLRSGSRFDAIKIFCVSEKAPDWKISDPRISVIPVPDLCPEYFLFNKIHMINSSAERVVFLDADTLVLRPIENVFENSGKDFLARVTNPYMRPAWSTAAWQKACAAVNAAVGPYFNSGFVIFQNSSHRKLDTLWPDVLRGGMNKSLYDAAALHVNPKYHDQRYLEQLSLSLAAAAAGLSWQEMKPTDHSYAWSQEPWTSATVYHTASPKFLYWAETIYRERGLSHQFDALIGQPHLFP